MADTRITLPNAIMLGEVDRLLQEGKSVIIMTKGNSMLPFIKGEKDSVELIRHGSYAIGDIVLAQITPGHFVLHRIISIGQDDVTLKGDGNLVGTEKCRLGDICGSVSYIIRPDGSRRSCSAAGFARVSAFWRSLPYIVRRIYLGLYRRIAL